MIEWIWLIPAYIAGVIAGAFLLAVVSAGRGPDEREAAEHVRETD